MTLIAWVFVAGTAAAEPGMCLSGGARPLQTEASEAFSLLPMTAALDADALRPAQASVAVRSASARTEPTATQEPSPEAPWCVAADSPECSQRGASHTPQFSSASVPGLGTEHGAMIRPLSQTLPLPSTPYRGGPAAGVRELLRRPPR